MTTTPPATGVAALASAGRRLCRRRKRAEDDDRNQGEDKNDRARDHCGSPIHGSDDSVRPEAGTNGDWFSRKESMLADQLPLFPLGTVLFPGMVLPLHIFEQRYRTMIA